ncbi:MAG: DUF1847 domain-containing protein [Chloroflexi bacterium]|nr:DUF1847 domain-containing protein [Chloroflexota bacterium]
MEDEMTFHCPTCGFQACAAAPGEKEVPDDCPMLRAEEALLKARAQYENPETRALALAAARTEADRYPLETRVEEVMSFARRIGATRLGIASCLGLLREARLFQEIALANGFEVEAVCCKMGNIPKEEIGLTDEEKIRPGQFEALCNPIGQAEVLNTVGTHLNVAIGLCVGHDSLFFRHSHAPVTVLVAKDRVTGHNPCAVLYTLHSYYRRLRES